MKFLVTCIILIVSLHAPAQSKGEIRKHRIRSVQITVQDSSKTERTEELKKFDAKGNLIVEEEYSKKGALKQKKERSYNSDREITEEKIYNEKGELTEVISTRFELGNPVLIEQKNGTGEVIQKIVINYNGFGEKMEEITYDKELKIVRKSIYTYNKKGLRTEKQTFNAQGQLIETKKYQYTF